MKDAPSRAAGEAVPIDHQVADAVGDLETPISDAVIMARIVSHLVESMMRSKTTIGTSTFYMIMPDNGEILTWAAYHAEELAEKAQGKWDEANTMAFGLRRAP